MALNKSNVLYMTLEKTIQAAITQRAFDKLLAAGQDPAVVIGELHQADFADATAAIMEALWPEIETLVQALWNSRREANERHGSGAWDVADVMAIVWPEIEELRTLLEQFCNTVVNTGLVEVDHAQDQTHHEDVAGLWLTARKHLDE